MDLTQANRLQNPSSLFNTAPSCPCEWIATIRNVLSLFLTSILFFKVQKHPRETKFVYSNFKFSGRQNLCLFPKEHLCFLLNELPMAMVLSNEKARFLSKLLAFHWNSLLAYPVYFTQNIFSKSSCMVWIILFFFRLLAID